MCSLAKLARLLFGSLASLARLFILPGSREALQIFNDKQIQIFRRIVRQQPVGRFARASLRPRAVLSLFFVCQAVLNILVLASLAIVRQP